MNVMRIEAVYRLLAVAILFKTWTHSHKVVPLKLSGLWRFQASALKTVSIITYYKFQDMSS